MNVTLSNCRIPYSVTPKEANKLIGKFVVSRTASKKIGVITKLGEPAGLDSSYINTVRVVWLSDQHKGKSDMVRMHYLRDVTEYKDNLAIELTKINVLLGKANKGLESYPELKDIVDENIT